MKITEIVLVSENWKGTETNFLMTVADYLKMVDIQRESEKMGTVFLQVTMVADTAHFLQT